MSPKPKLNESDHWGVLVDPFIPLPLLPFVAAAADDKKTSASAQSQRQRQRTSTRRCTNPSENSLHCPNMNTAKMGEQ
eukprot:scaffold11620_cov199-Skeletonema_dohrnii-CCMP3373.AAC.1